MKRPFRVMLRLITICVLLTPFSGGSQIISTVAGTGSPGYNGDSIPASAAQLQRPTGIYVDSVGNIYFCDEWNYRVREIDHSGIIHTIAGNGTTGTYSGEGGPATAAVTPGLRGISIAPSGGLLFCMIGSGQNRVVQIYPSGIISTIAGIASGVGGFSGDGGPATNAQLSGPWDVSKDQYGALYVGDVSNARVRKVEASGIITTIAGMAGLGYSSDGIPATASLLANPYSIAVDRHGNVYIADGTNYRIRKVDTTGIITTVAGYGISGYSGDGGPATLAKIKQTGALDIDELGNLYLADRFNNALRKINANTGIITTIAGNGTAGYSGDGGPASAALLNYPFYVSVHPNGDVYFTEYYNHCIRKISYGNHIPVAETSTEHTVTICENVGSPLNSELSVIDLDTGQTLNWLLYTPPIHGVATVTFTAATTGAAVTPSGLQYLPTTGFSGNDSFEVRIDDGISACYVTFHVIVMPMPVAAPLTGSDTICIGDTATLTGATTAGTWTSSDTSIATISLGGTCTGLTSGTTVMTYIVSNTCGSDTATLHFFVLPPDACSSGTVESNQLKESSLITPNPNGGRFVVHLPRHLMHLALTDIYGNVLGEYDESGDFSITADLPTGLYLLRISDNRENQTIKLCITR